MAKMSRLDAVWLLLTVCALLAVPILAKKSYIVHEVTIFMLLLAIVIHWNIVFGYGGILSLGQTAFFGVGGYVAAIGLKFFGIDFPTAFLLATISGGVFGLVVGLACLRVRGPYVAFITLAIMVALQKLIQTDLNCMFEQQYTCSSLTGGSMGLSRFGRIDQFPGIGPFNVSYLLALANVVLAMLFASWLVQGVVGRALVAIRDNEQLAAVRGINRVRIHTLVFVLCAALTGLTGGLYIGYNGTVGPTMMDFSLLTLLLTMMIVGGTGTLYGPVLGAVAIYGMDFWFKDLGEWRSMALGLVTVLAILVLPGGIMGSAQSILRTASRHFVKRNKQPLP